MIYTDSQLKEKIVRMIESFENEVVEFKEARTNYSFNDIGKYFLIIRSKKNTLFSSEYFFSFILLPLRYFFYLNQKGTLYNFKSKYQFPCFCVFFTLFLRRCKYYCVYLSDLYFCFDYPPQVSLL